MPYHDCCHFEVKQVKRGLGALVSGLMMHCASLTLPHSISGGHSMAWIRDVVVLGMQLLLHFILFRDVAYVHVRVLSLQSACSAGYLWALPGPLALL